MGAIKVGANLMTMRTDRGLFKGIDTDIIGEIREEIKQLLF